MLPRAEQGDLASSRPIHKIHSGFTSVELLVSIALLGITLALALPSYRDMVEKRQLTQGAEQIFAFLNSTQGIASRSNSVVKVDYFKNPSADDDWCVGAVLGDESSPDCDCRETVDTEPDFCQIDGIVMRLTNDHVGNTGIMQSVSGDGNFAFDPVRGLMVDTDDSLDMTLQSPSGDYQLRLVVSNTGHAVLCSVDGHEVPGYGSCP